MTANTAKYLSYAEAWRRIKAATEAGFYFEAVTLCESIISDRLLSYICGTNLSSEANTHTAFASLIADWRKLAKSLPSHGASDLGAAVDLWRKERNVIVHGLTKSAPGTATDDLQPFLVRAEATAKNGAVLARAVSGWHKKELANSLAVKRHPT